MKRFLCYLLGHDDSNEVWALTEFGRKRPMRLYECSRCGARFWQFAGLRVQIRDDDPRLKHG
jgi:hypothetical protein